MSRSLCAVLLVLCLTPSIFAQFDVWDSPNGVRCRESLFPYSTDQGMDCDEQGNFLVAWSDARTGIQAVYLMLFAPDGNPLWQANGVCMAQGETGNFHPRVKYAGNSQWFVLWQVGTFNSSNSYDLRLQKVESTGSFLWGEDGILVESVDDIYPDERISMYTDHSEEPSCYITWMREVRELSLWCQKYDSNGSRCWGDSSIIVADTVYYMDACPDENGGMYFLWNRCWGWETPMFVQHVSPSGELLLGNSTEGLPTIGLETSNYELNVCSDGAGGAFFAYTAYIEENPARVFGIHITAEHELFWMEEYGLCLTPGFEIHHFLELTPAGPGEFIAYWDGSLPDNSGYIYGQKFSASEFEVTPLWNDGEPVQISEDFNDPSGEETWFSATVDRKILWFDNEESSNGYIYGQQLTEDGEAVWSLSPSFEVSGFEYAAASMWTGASLVCMYNEEHPEESGVHLNGFDADGSAVWDADGFPASTGMNGGCSRSTIASSSNHVFIAWEDSRMAENNQRIPCCQVLSLEDGDALHEPYGIPLIESYGNETTHAWSNYIQMTSDNQEGVIAIWYADLQSTERYKRIFAQRINPSGEMLWGNNGIEIEWDRSEYTNADVADNALPSIISLTDSTYIVAFEVSSPDHESALVVQRLDRDANQGWESAPLGFILAEGESYSNLYGLQSTADGSTYIMYNTYDDRNVYLQKITSDGELGWDESLLIVEYESVRNIQMVAANNSLVVVWQEGEFLQGQLVTTNGDLLHPIEGETICSIHQYSNFAIRGTDDLSFWLVWSAYPRPRYNRLNTLFNSVIGSDNGFELFSGDISYFTNFELCSDDDNGIYVFWKSFNDDRYSYRYTHILEDGAFADEEYATEGAILSETYGGVSDLCIDSDGFHGVVTAWTDTRARRVYYGGGEAYAMRVNDFTIDAPETGYTALPAQWELFPAYPNPFNPSTNLSFTVPEYGIVRLTVCDILGREVVRLADGPLSAGVYTYSWDGMDRNGRAVASGTYFFRLDGEGVNTSRSMILLK